MVFSGPEANASDIFKACYDYKVLSSFLISKLEKRGSSRHYIT